MEHIGCDSPKAEFLIVADRDGPARKVLNHVRSIKFAIEAIKVHRKLDSYDNVKMERFK
jgi:hypothetical protein